MSVTTRRNNPIRERQGFTFIELFIIVAILGILAAVSVPRLKNTFDSLRISNFSQQLLSFMNYLHERSIVEGKVIRLSIDYADKEIRADIAGKDTALKAYPFLNNMDIKVSKGRQEEENELYFYPDGSIDKFSLTIKTKGAEGTVLTTEGVFGKVKMQKKK